MKTTAERMSATARAAGAPVRGVGLALAMLTAVAVSWVDIASATQLKVLKTGLGSGTVSGASVNCGTTCDATYSSAVTVSLTAMADADSRFVGWSGACSGTTCSVVMGADRFVRAEFRLATPYPTMTETQLTPLGTGMGGIEDFIASHSTMRSAARFISALPAEFKQDWIPMSRSESLQPGTARLPRFLLPSADARFVFSVGLAAHGSYPGAHPSAIEYMQWDAGQKNFRFHEIVLEDIPALGVPGTPGYIAMRPRGVAVDDAKCPACHATRNVLNRTSSNGTTGTPPGTVAVKNKPNWDAYDSWGGMMPFNRDRIYQDSVEEAAFKHLFNLWNWRGADADDAARRFIEQLALQPPSVPATGPHRITRNPDAVTDAGHISFGYEGLTTPVATALRTTDYSFGGPSEPASSVTQGGRYVTLRHSNPRIAYTSANDDYSDPGSDEGRAVRFFDLLGGFGLGGSNLNVQRIAAELISHRFATGGVGIDVRPVALAVTKGCFNRNAAANTVTSTVSPAVPGSVLDFFNVRHGRLNPAGVFVAGSINDLYDDTQERARSLPRRKADIERLNLDRANDPYLFAAAPADGLIALHGAATPSGTLASLPRVRQEVFRRPVDLGISASTVAGDVYVDREDYAYNVERIALYRYFLEPLGVSVDKWSMAVRGRSRTYAFADVFSQYRSALQSALETSLGLAPSPACDTALMNLVQSSLASLPAASAVPEYTDIQRIFNKSCIECHGGLGYPPYGPGFVDLSENESPPAGVSRLQRSHDLVTTAGLTTIDPLTSYLYQLITRPNETLANCRPGGLAATDMMPCGGPRLSAADIDTVRRWIVGGSSFTEGDRHIRTVDGVHYDFQSAGEFVLLRGEALEIQARQTPVQTEGPLGPNAHTGLSSCVSINTAVAVRVGGQRITYQPNLNGEPDPTGLQLRIDGKLTRMSPNGIPLAAGGRIVATTADGGIRVEGPGGSAVVITPGWWDHYRLWYLNIETRHVRATDGVMGAIAAGNWLPALPDGTFLGPRPVDTNQRYRDLYEKFADAWRVTDATSLFDYLPGTSTGSYILASWPGESPRSCTLPKPLGGKTPPKPLPAAIAAQHCSAVVAPERKANCLQDVMVTGEPGFAKTYLAAEKIARNAAPVAPRLLFPDQYKADLARTVTFTWKESTDSGGDPVRYRNCVWPAGERFTDQVCSAVSERQGGWRAGLLYAGLVGLAGCVVFAVLIFTGKGRGLLALVSLLILAAIVFVFSLGRTDVVSAKLVRLEPRQTYYWKVVAEDDKGGRVESELRRFTVK